MSRRSIFHLPDACNRFLAGSLKINLHQQSYHLISITSYSMYSPAQSCSSSTTNVQPDGAQAGARLLGIVQADVSALLPNRLDLSYSGGEALPQLPLCCSGTGVAAVILPGASCFCGQSAWMTGRNFMKQLEFVSLLCSLE